MAGEGLSGSRGPQILTHSAAGARTRLSLTFGEHARYVDSSEGRHVGEVGLSTGGGVEMSV